MRSTSAEHPSMNLLPHPRPDFIKNFWNLVNWDKVRLG